MWRAGCITEHGRPRFCSRKEHPECHEREKHRATQTWSAFHAAVRTPSKYAKTSKTLVTLGVPHLRFPEQWPAAVASTHKAAVAAPGSTKRWPRPLFMTASFDVFSVHPVTPIDCSVRVNTSLRRIRTPGPTAQFTARVNTREIGLFPIILT